MPAGPGKKCAHPLTLKEQDCITGSGNKYKQAHLLSPARLQWERERQQTVWVQEVQAAQSAGNPAPGGKGTLCFPGDSGYTEAPSPSRPLGRNVELSSATMDHEQNRMESREVKGGV